jgi:hypothetical protein
MSLLSLAVVAVIAQPAQDPSVTVIVPAAPVPRVLAQISEASGIRLQSSPQVDLDVVTMSVDEVPLSEVMQRLAYVVNGTWRQEQGGYRLTRTTIQIREEEQAARAEVLDHVRRSLESTRKKLAAREPWSEKEADRLATALGTKIREFTPERNDGRFYLSVLALTSQQPWNRAADEILLTISPEELADMEPQVLYTWSSKPNRTQKPLPRRAVEIFERTKTHALAWEDLRRRRGVVSPTVNGVTHLMPGLDDGQGRVDADPDKVVVTASKWSANAGAQIGMYVLDARGRLLTSVGTFLNPDPTVTPPPAGEVPVEEKLETPELLAWVGPLFVDGEVDPGALQRVGDMVALDPLEWIVSPLLRQVAKRQGLQLVACLDDASVTKGASFRLVGSILNSTISTPSQMKASLGSDHLLEEQEGWLVVRPKSLHRVREHRVSRSALRDYVVDLSQSRALTMDSLGRHALSLYRPDPNPLVRVAKSLAGSQARETAVFSRWLAFYGTLSQDQARTARAASGLPLAQLRPDQRELARKLVYGLNNSWKEVASSGRAGGAVVESSVFYLGTLVTEVIPNGIPANASLKIVDGREEAVQLPERRSVEGFRYGGQVMTARDLGQLIARQRMPNPPGGTPAEPISQVRYGGRHSMELAIGVAPGVSVGQSAALVDWGQGAKFIPFASLPAEFRQKVERSAKDFERMVSGG